MNSSSGAPIPYALVQAGQESKLADQNGNFSFDDLPTVTAVAARKPGFFDEGDVNDTHTARPPTILADQPTSITLRLIPEAVIIGHVEDSEGEPLEGLPVNVRRVQYMNGHRILQQQRGQATDEDGNFRIANIRPGTYYVGVGPNFRARMSFFSEEQSSNQKAEVFPAVYYPGVRDLSAAMPLRLGPGQRATLDFNLRRVPAYRVNGLITGLTNSNGGMNLVDSDGENANIPVRFFSQTSRFEIFPIPAGSYRLRFNGQEGDGQQLFADVPLNVTGNIGELHVPVARAVNIPVVFDTEFTKQNSAPQNGIVSAVSSGGGTPIFYGQLHLVSRKPPYQQYYSTREKPESGMLIRGVEPGTYDVETNPNGATYVASVTCGGIDLLHQPLVIPEGAEPQPIEIVLRDDGASLSGSVQFPDGTQSAQVLMIAEGAGTDAPRPLFVDRTGNFHAQELAPGTYDILAFDRLDGIEYGNREALSAYLGQATHVTLSADQQAKVTVGVIRTQQ